MSTSGNTTAHTPAGGERAAIALRLELLLIPVSDVDRAKAFYSERLGFGVDADHRAGEAFRVVQLTPPGSDCSISIGTGITDAAPGSNLHTNTTPRVARPIAHAATCAPEHSGCVCCLVREK